MRLLVAEDDLNLLKSLTHILKTNGYEVDGVSDGLTAFDYATSSEYDAFVFDIMMPGIDGIECLKRIRKSGNTTPALFLTAKTEISDKVIGLDAGADDYISKPFSIPELLARIRAILRRKSNYIPDIKSFNEVEIDKSTYELIYKEKRETLGRKELQILEYLFSRPEKIVTIEQIYDNLWGLDGDVEFSVIWVHISNIRKKIDALEAPIQITFLRNCGYKLSKK